VRFNGSDRTTTFVSATQLTAQITAADVAVAGTPSITVFNPAPGGGTSAVQTLTINNPLPTVTTLAPDRILEGSAAFVLTINGANFVNSSVVQWNGQNRTTSFVSSTQLTAQIAASDVAAAGTANLTVSSPSPGGGTSNPVTFSIDTNSRVVTVVNSSGSANTTVTVPINLSSQGDENSISFSMSYDTALLSNPQAIL
jgi:hypothetical protein